MPITQNTQQIVEKLKQGDIVAIPTETVYGLAGRVDSEQAIRKIFSIKERPFFDPLIVHVKDISQAKGLVLHWGKASEILANAFWPGPLTLVLPKNPHKVSDLITSGLGNVGIRLPKHPQALEVLKELGVPLAAPSANRFGRTSPSRAEHVLSEFGEELFILDGGPCDVGIESTVLWVGESSEITSLSILRPGKITETQIQAVLDREKIPYNFTHVSTKSSPGHMQHHYMPDKPLIWVEGEFSEEEISEKTTERFQKIPDEVDGVKIKKSLKYNKGQVLQFSMDPILAARQLYSELRLKSEMECDFIIFKKEEHQFGEMWGAFLDRLSKASSLKLVSSSEDKK